MFDSKVKEDIAVLLIDIYALRDSYQSLKSQNDSLKTRIAYLEQQPERTREEFRALLDYLNLEMEIVKPGFKIVEKKGASK